VVAPRPLFFGVQERYGLGAGGISYWSDGLADGALKDDTFYGDTSGRVWTYGPPGTMQAIAQGLSISIFGLAHRSQIEALADGAGAIKPIVTPPPTLIVPGPGKPATPATAESDNTLFYVGLGVASVAIVGVTVYFLTKRRRAPSRSYRRNPRRRSRSRSHGR